MIFHFDQYTLDTDRLELKCGAWPIDLEPQVFSVLSYLVENRDHVVSKDDLIEAVWDGRIVSDSTLNSRINLARRAVGDDGKSQSVIRTFPRRGFRFVADVAEDGKERPAQQGFGGELREIARSHRPSIVVLPFENMSSDPEHEFFADGITEDISTALSKHQWLAVTARNTSFAYKGRHVDVRRLADEHWVSTTRSKEAYAAQRPFRKGLSGRCRCDSRKVVETDLEPPCGRRPPESSIAARRCVIRLI